MEVLVYNLCGVKFTNYLADIIVVIFLIAFAVVCAKRGFVECFFGFVSTVAAILAAVLLAKTVLSITGGLFGFQKYLTKLFSSGFAKLDGFDADVSAQGVEAALADKNLPAILARLTLKWFGKSDVAAGTTLATMVGATTARLAALLFTGILIFVLCKLLFALAKKFLNALADRIFLLEAVNSVLGAAVGLLQGLLFVCLALSLLTLIPSQTVGNYLQNSILLKAVYNYNPLVTVLGWFL